MQILPHLLHGLPNVEDDRLEKLAVAWLLWYMEVHRNFACDDPLLGPGHTAGPERM